MPRSLFSGSTSPTVFLFPDGQEAGETFRIVAPGDDGSGSILARRYRIMTDNQSSYEYASFHTTADAYTWIAEGVGANDALDAYYDTPLAGLEIVEPAPEAPKTKPARTRKPKAPDSELGRALASA